MRNRKKKNPSALLQIKTPGVLYKDRSKEPFHLGKFLYPIAIAISQPAKHQRDHRLTVNTVQDRKARCKYQAHMHPQHSRARTGGFRTRPQPYYSARSTFPRPADKCKTPARPSQLERKLITTSDRATVLRHAPPSCTFRRPADKTIPTARTFRRIYKSCGSMRDGGGEDLRPILQA